MMRISEESGDFGFKFHSGQPNTNTDLPFILKNEHPENTQVIQYVIYARGRSVIVADCPFVAVIEMAFLFEALSIKYIEEFKFMPYALIETMFKIEAPQNMQSNRYKNIVKKMQLL